jgi:hypothetical protein
MTSIATKIYFKYVDNDDVNHERKMLSLCKKPIAQLDQKELFDLFVYIYSHFGQKFVDLKKLVDHMHPQYIDPNLGSILIRIIWSQRFDLELIQYILDKKFDPNNGTTFGPLPLSLLLELSFGSNMMLSALIKMFLEAGANPQIVNNFSFNHEKLSPLQYAEKYGMTEIVDLFKLYIN